MSEGFFTKKQVQSKTRPDGRTYSCASCGLYKDSCSPKMKPVGNFKKGILNIGGAPTIEDDEKGKPFQGKAGRLLQKNYRGLGIDLWEDCLNVTAVNCLPIGKKGIERIPTNYEIECCRKSILTIIEEHQPKVIVLFGDAAIWSLIGHRWKKNFGDIEKWRGWQIPDRDFSTWICPVYHPDQVAKGSSEVETVWKQDLEAVVRMSNTPFPALPSYTIEIIQDLSPLTNITDTVAIDYETTGLKPHAPGHRIVCAAVATSENHCYAFMMPAKQSERKPFLDLLANEEIGKMAHNIKFEEIWSTYKLRQPVMNWKWDSMQAAHILDNRPSITSLKFQTYVMFGIVDYASEVTPHLEGDKNDGNSFNSLLTYIEKRSNRKTLLTYCGLDTIYQYRLAKIQTKIIG